MSVGGGAAEGRDLRLVRSATVSCSPLASPLSPAPPSCAMHLGEAPVHDLHLAEGADHDVRRLEVAVDHAAGVGVGDRLADLLEDREEAAPRSSAGVGPLVEQRGERAAVDQLHGEVRAGSCVEAEARRPGRCRGAGAGRRSALPRRSGGSSPDCWRGSGWSTLTATSRPRSGSRPLRTTPMPPRAISPRTW